MPTFSRSLEQSLHRALALANERHHEYATLEHLLLALIEDQDAAAVMRACNVDLEKLRRSLVAYLESELDNLVTDGAEDSKPTAGFQRVIQRAVIHVQSSGREEVTGANVLVAIFAERESHAAYFLQEQDMTRYDAVNYISHGIAKRPGMSEARPVRGADEENDAKSGDEQKKKGDALDAYCVNLNKKAREGKIDPLIGRESEINRTIQVLCRRQKNNPLFVGEAGVGKTAIAEGLARRIVHGEVPDVLRNATVFALDMGTLLGRHALSRRLRGAAQAGHQGARGLSRRDPVHRRDPHRDRRRRHLRRRHGCVEPAQAGLGVRHGALHRLDHLQGIPAVFREGSRAGAPVPEDRRQRADDPGRHRNPQGAEALFRGLSQAPLHQRSHQGGGGIVVALHPRPQAARQGDRRDRRIRRGADAAAGEPAQAHHRAQGDRDHDRHHGADSAEGGVEGRRRGAPAFAGDAQARGLRPGQGDRGAVGLDQARPRRLARAGKADRLLPVLRPDRRRQDRSRAAAGGDARRRDHPLRHVGIYGAPHRVAAHRRAARLCRLRPGRLAHRRRRPASALRAAPRRDREGASGSVQRAPADHGSRQADRPQRQAGRFPQRHPDHDHQCRRRRHGARRVRLYAHQARGRRHGGDQPDVRAGIPQPARRHHHLRASVARRHRHGGREIRAAARGAARRPRRHHRAERRSGHDG